MRPNRSVPPCPVIPVLIYPDPSAAADWLSKAFGFTTRLRIANHRIQMKAGEGCFTIAEGNVTPNNSHIVQVRIEDAMGHCQRARQHGATILTEPKDQPYGERQYNAQDFHGHRWDFTETISDVAVKILGIVLARAAVPHGIFDTNLNNVRIVRRYISFGHRE